MLGEHTIEVLRERLGLDDEGIAGLVSEGVVRTWSPPVIP